MKELLSKVTELSESILRTPANAKKRNEFKEIYTTFLEKLGEYFRELHESEYAGFDDDEVELLRDVEIMLIDSYVNYVGLFDSISTKTTSHLHRLLGSQFRTLKCIISTIPEMMELVDDEILKSFPVFFKASDSGFDEDDVELISVNWLTVDNMLVHLLMKADSDVKLDNELIKVIARTKEEVFQHVYGGFLGKGCEKDKKAISNFLILKFNFTELYYDVMPDEAVKKRDEKWAEVNSKIKIE